MKQFLYLSSDVKPTDRLWYELNRKDSGKPMTDREGLEFRNLIRACSGQVPLRDNKDPIQRAESKLKERIYNHDWKLRKKAEQQQAV